MYPIGIILKDKYQIEQFIGQGAFSEVYLALHRQLNARRALKILRRDMPGMGSTIFSECSQRFQLEAQLGARLDNAHVIRVHDFEPAGDELVLVMEYAPGGSLAGRIEQARLANTAIPMDEILRIALELSGGLAAIHNLDVVHRDLKPSNVLFGADGSAKISDLGLAQVPGGPSMRSQVSQALPHPGTPTYMSPEQRTTTDYLNSASDVYSLGAVIFEMLTLRVYRNLRKGTAPSSLRPDTPDWLDILVQGMLADNPNDRPFNGEDVKTAILKAGQTVQKKKTREAEAPQDEMTLRLAPGVNLILVRVPAGEFLYRENNWKVFQDEFWIGKYPVTKEQYWAYLTANPGIQSGKLPEDKKNHPVVNISWKDANAFCAWASWVTGKTLRLPTAAEWEKAARGPKGQPYPWGSQVPDKTLCNFGDIYYGTTPVGKFSPQGDSPYGCADMAGNVYEWTADWADEDPVDENPGPNPQSPPTGIWKIMCGGSWGSSPDELCVRDWDEPDKSYKDLGFRCAC